MSRNQRPLALKRQFQKRIEEYDELAKALVLGTSCVRKSHRDAAISLGRTAGLDEALRRYPYSQRTMYFVWLVFLIRILEDMIAEYSVWCSLHRAYYTGRPPNSQNSQVAQTLTYRTRYSHCSHSWEKKVKDWSENGIKNRTGNKSMAQASSNQAIKTVSNAAGDFRYWFDLYKPYIIRNLEIHNGGKMDDRNIRQLPLCGIGRRPKWEMGMIYGLRDALWYFNEHLAATLVSSGSRP